MPAKEMSIQDMDVVILCGGAGTRLRSVVQDRPKPMAEIAGRPFLALLVEYVSHHGFRRFIFCTGYKGDWIERYYEKEEGRLCCLFSREEVPLGTAGAIKKAESLIRSETFLVLNGDSWCEVDLEEFVRFHRVKGAVLSMVSASVESSSGYGMIELDNDQSVLRFGEKTNKPGKTLINAGIYLFQKEVLREIPEGRKWSLEYDLFPGRVKRGFYGFVTEQRLLDLGTPERLEAVQAYFERREG